MIVSVSFWHFLVTFSSNPAMQALYDRGCDNWLTICNVNFTLEHEEGSCSYLKQVG